MKILRARHNKYKTPKWWKRLENLVPDIRLLFLNPFILKDSRLRKLVNSIPNQCPFNRAYELELIPFGKRYLIFFMPALCKLNPFYNWIIDLKVEVFSYERKVRELTKLAELKTTPEVNIQIPI